MRGHNNNKILSLTLGLLACVAAAAYAEPRVGPLDGKRVESLPALATPQGVAEEKITDTGFAERMEQAEDWATALYAWQKIADESPAWAQAEALHRVANAQQKLGYTHAARVTYQRILEGASSDDAKAETYYYVLHLADPAEQATLLVNVLALQPQTAAGKAWKSATLYHSVWTEAQAGSVTATYSIPKAEELKARVARMDADLAAHKATATRYGVLPGLGHAYLGRPQSAAAMLPVWALFGWAMFYALRRKQWPYALIWALAFFGIWFSGPAQARKLADTINADTRMTALNSWENLMPAAPTQAELQGAATVEELSAQPVAVETPVPEISTTTVPDRSPSTPLPTLNVQMREDGKLQGTAVSITEPAVHEGIEPKPLEKPKATTPPKPKKAKPPATAPVGTGAPTAWDEPSPTSYFSIRPAQ